MPRWLVAVLAAFVGLGPFAEILTCRAEAMPFVTAVGDAASTASGIDAQTGSPDTDEAGGGCFSAHDHWTTSAALEANLDLETRASQTARCTVTAGLAAESAVLKLNTPPPRV